MRYYIYISLIAVLSVLCFNNAMGQGISPFGANRAQDTSKTKGQIVATAYANPNPAMFVRFDSKGHMIMAIPAGSGGGLVDSVTISNDSLFYWGGGVSFFVGIVNSGGSIDTTGLSDRIAYNLTRIDGLSDTATLHADTLESHKDWLSSIESEIAAIPTANDFQSVLDNGNTSNKDFIVERSSYTGYTRIGDGISSIYPPNSSRVSFYVTSKTSGQGAGSGIGYGIQSIAEYTDTVGFLSSTTLIGSKGTAVATSSTPGGGLYDHEFTNGSAAANMSGLIGEALTFGNSYSTSAAGVTAIVEPFQQSHIGFGASFLSIGTRRRTGTTLDSIAGLYVQQRNYALGSGTLGANFGIFIDSMVGGNTNYGIFLKNNPSNGSIATENGHDFSIKTGVGGATKIHRSLYVYDTANHEGEVYTPNLPRGKQDSVVYIDTDGRHYKGVVPDTIAAGDGIVATKGARTVTLTVDTSYLETMFFKNYGNSFGDDFKMGNMNWNQFIYGDGNGDFIFNNGSGPGWMFHFVQNNLDTPLTINTQNETLLGMSGGKVTDRGYYILQANGGVWFEDSVTIENIPKRATAPDTTVGIVNGVLVAYPTVTGGGSGTVTSFTFTDGNGFDGTVTNSTTTPTLAIDLQADHNFVTDAELTNFTAAYNDKINSGAFSAGQLTLTQQDAGTVTATINDATTSVKGIASFNASDFDVSSGAVSIDYTNGQAASGSTKGLLTSADWTAFNNKQAALGFTAVPDTRTVNGQALSSNVTVSTITGNAGTATALQTGRTIDNTTFDGTANIKLNRVWQGKLAGETDTLTTGVKLTFRMPYACTITGVKAAVNTASSSGNITIDIHENGTTIMSANKITIEATETTSLDATTQPGVTDTSIAADALIQVEVDAAGTNAISGEVTIYYTLQ